MATIDFNDDSSSDSDDMKVSLLEAIQLKCPLRDGFGWILVSFVVTLLQIVAAIVVLILTKDSQEMFFRLIISYAGGCFVALPVLSLRFCHYHTNCTSERRIHEVIDKLMNMIEYFFVGWAVVLIWHLINNSPFLDPPPTQQFWLCMVFLAISCVLHVFPNFPCAIVCFLYPLLLRLFQYVDIFEDFSGYVDLLNWKIFAWVGVFVFPFSCIVCCWSSCRSCRG